MTDDVDDLVRDALGTLEAPDGYFDGDGDGLAERTLARLDDPLPELAADEAVGDDAVIGEARDEDSGLHDIVSLASEAKARLRRSSAAEAVARGPAASAAWRAVALPDPRKAEAGAEPLDGRGQARAGSAAEGQRGSIDELARERALRVAPPSTTPAVPVPVRIRRPTLVAAGLAVAAAAAAVLFVTTDRPRDTQVASGPAPDRAPAFAPAKADRSPDPAPPAPVATGSEAATETPVEPPKKIAVELPRPTRPRPAPKGKASKSGDKPIEAKLEAKPAEPAPGTANEPDEIAQEVDRPPPKVGSKLERQGLDAADIKRAMAAVAGPARRCYTGTSGVASVRLTVAPTGQITKITVTGPFAGTPVAACVERAVRAARFPAWDGGPQSFGYSYLLAE